MDLEADQWILNNPELAHNSALAFCGANAAAYEALCADRGLPAPDDQRDERPEYKAAAHDAHVAVTAYLAALAEDTASADLTCATLYEALKHY